MLDLQRAELQRRLGGQLMLPADCCEYRRQRFPCHGSLGISSAHHAVAVGVSVEAESGISRQSVGLQRAEVEYLILFVIL